MRLISLLRLLVIVLLAMPVLMVLAIDLIVFSSLITLIITGVREGQMSDVVQVRCQFGRPRAKVHEHVLGREP